MSYSSILDETSLGSNRRQPARRLTSNLLRDLVKSTDSLLILVLKMLTVFVHPLRPCIGVRVGASLNIQITCLLDQQPVGGLAISAVEATRPGALQTARW